MKKVLLVVIMFLMFAGVITASSINGDYNGKPIVKMKSNGQVLAVEDAPAVIMDGRTMVPISMLRQIGLGVEWNAEEYSVNVTLPEDEKVEPVESFIDIPEFSKVMKDYNVGGVSYMSTGNGSDQITFFYNLSLVDSTTNPGVYNDLDGMFSGAMITDASSVVIYGVNNNTFTVQMSVVNDFYEGDITVDQFWDNIVIDGPVIEGSTYNEPIYVQPAPPTNVTTCTDINAYYDQQVIDATNDHNRRGGAYSGGLQYQLDTIESNRTSELQMNGCTQ
jgi:hypothetical protein